MALKPGYKQTEVGMIPEDWELRKLEDVSIISRLAGAEYTSLWKETPDGEIIALRGFNIGRGRIIERDFVRISNELSLKLKRSRLCKGDVVYPCVGSIGNAAAINEDNKYHIQQNIARITPNPAAISSRYLANFLMSFLGEREVARFNASSSQPSVLVSSLRQYRVPLPPTKAEQEAIADALSDADALIESLEQLIAKKRQIKQGAMQELLTGRNRLPGFSGEWEVKQIQDISDVDPESLGSDIRPEYAFKYISLEEVDRGTVKGWTEQVFATAPSRARRKIRKGDVLVSTVRPNLQSHCLIQTDLDDLICSTGFSVIRCRPGVAEPPYVFAHFFASFIERQIEALVTGSNYPAINSSDVKRLKILLPPTFSEQTAIATILTDMDAEIVALEAKLAKACQLKQGMMQELLTGRIRLV